MLQNVLYESKNMKYDELVKYAKDNQMLVVCCIESHFTGFQIMKNNKIIYYDPLSSNINLIEGEE